MLLHRLHPDMLTAADRGNCKLPGRRCCNLLYMCASPPTEGCGSSDARSHVEARHEDTRCLSGCTWIPEWCNVLCWLVVLAHGCIAELLRQRLSRAGLSVCIWAMQRMLKRGVETLRMAGLPDPALRAGPGHRGRAGAPEDHELLRILCAPLTHACWLQPSRVNRIVLLRSAFTL